MGGENEVRWSQTGSGWSLAIRIHFTRLVREGKTGPKGKKEPLS
jgi:hypothetical protein